jgi:hypothetical protein
MALGKQSLGLCSTCNSSSICTRRKGIRLPVLWCEEFDDLTLREVERQPVPVIADKEAALDTAMGLCCNCGNQGACTSQHSPGGVWHCEEYC